MSDSGIVQCATAGFTWHIQASTFKSVSRPMPKAFRSNNRSKQLIIGVFLFLRLDSFKAFHDCLFYGFTAADDNNDTARLLRIFLYR